MRCEICGSPRVVWRGSVRICGICSAMYDSWAEGKEPRPAISRFVAAAAVDAAGGDPLEAARRRREAGAAV